MTIYISDEQAHSEVEHAVEELLGAAGLYVSSRSMPRLGSWYRALWASLGSAAHSRAAKELGRTAAHAADARYVLAQDASITATMLANLGPVIVSLQPTKDAVVRVGAILIVKIEWVVAVHQLTAAQQFELDHQPHLAMAPREILQALGLEKVEGEAVATRSSQSAESSTGA